MGDNAPYGPDGQAPPAYPEQGRPTVHGLLRSLAEGQRVNQDTMNGLAQAITALLNTQTRGIPSQPPITGPKVKEPHT